MRFAHLNNYKKYNNSALLQLIATDDTAAFTELYDRHWQKLFTIAYNRLTDIQTAEDVVHDVFVSLWAGRKSIHIDILDNYLASAVKYAVLTNLKKKAKEKIYQQSVSQTPVVTMQTEASLHYKRILEIVRTEIEKLPAKCKLIFKYSRDVGMPVKEIAKTLNISPKTVENQITSALKQLKKVTKALISLFVLYLIQ